MERPIPLVVKAANIAAKVLLLFFLTLVLIDPHWGNLEGKAPVARAITYPIWAFAIPAIWAIGFRRHRYPWVVDLLITLICFTDILGNRLDFYDRVVWFDDWMHFMNTGLVSAAVLLLTLPADASLVTTLERSIAVGLTASLAWELFEYVTFVTRSREYTTAYRDTLGDLTLGWLGAVVAALVVAALRQRRRAGRNSGEGAGPAPLRWTP